MTSEPLILKSAPIGRLVVGRIFFLDAVGPACRPWMWASGHSGQISRATHGHDPTREAAMAAFAKSWRQE